MWMGSLDKIKTKKVFEMWLQKLQKYKIQYVVITPKLDGVSALFGPKNPTSNNLEGAGVSCSDTDIPIKYEMYSRGDGVIGSSLERVVPFVSHTYNNPLPAHGDFIRGELVMRKDVFNVRYSKEYKNPRNLVAGQLVKNTLLPLVLKDISFVPYELISKQEENIPPSEQLSFMHGSENFLNDSGFIWLKVASSSLSFDLLDDLLDRWNLQIPYNIDGLVLAPDIRYKTIKNGNPKLTVAFKKSAESDDTKAVATVSKVVWGVSKWGVYKPVVYIEPTSLNGVIISKISGHNAKNIVEKKIGKDAVVKFVRSGQVIPYIVEVLIPSNSVVVPEGVWKGVDIYVQEKKMGEKKDPVIETARQIKGLDELFQKLGVKNISSKTIEKIYNVCELTTFFDIINCKPSDLAPAFPENSKTNQNIIEEFQKLKCRKIPAHLLVSASGVLGQGVGPERVKSLLKMLGYKCVPTVTQVVNIEGFAKKTAEQIVARFPEMQMFIQRCQESGLNIFVDSQEAAHPTPIICLSGFRDKAIEDYFTVKNSVTGDTQYLVVKNRDITTDKMKQAQKKGVCVITPDELSKLYPYK